MIRLSLPLSQFFDVFRLDEPRVPQAIAEEIVVVHDDALDRDLGVQDETTNGIVIPGAAADGISIFSFASDHYIQSIAITVQTNPANLEYVYLTSQAFGQFDQGILFFAAQANVVTHTSRNIGGVNALAYVVNQHDAGYPFFGRRETDYVFMARSTAGGGVTLQVRIRRTEAVEGVRIAR